MNPTQTGKPRLRKFHIGTGQSDQEIIDQFVVRQPQLDCILEVLNGNLDAESCQHLLVVAPRGRGKTTLLVRVIAELRTNDEFSTRLLPVRLMEESQEIFNLADFWLECLYYLAKSCAELHSELADELVAQHAALAEDWTDKTLEGRARAAVLDAADRLDRKLLIMAENLQSLFDEAEDDFGWGLRQVLQSEPQIMLLATATSRFEALEDATAPFFEMFRVVNLPPLDVAECRLLWQAISGETVDERGIRPLRILTGGSPRLMVVLAGFTRDRSLRQLMDQLVTLIDDHTEYFRGQMDELASTERRVYIALIDLWQASTTSEVAARARMEIRKVSSLLGRLAKRGAVVAEGSGNKRTYYAAERLYSIYYKLRRDRDEAAVVQNLVHFMVTYYRGNALAELSRSFVAEASGSDAIREGLVRAAAQMPELRKLVEGYGLSLPTPAAPNARTDDKKHDALDDFHEQFENGDYAAVVASVDTWLRESYSVGSTVASEAVARAVYWKALALGELAEWAAAIETFASMVERFGESDDRELQLWVARALFGQAAAQYELGDPAAIEAYDSVVDRFGESEDRDLRVQVAQALVNQGVTQGQLGDPAAAIETFASVIERFGASEDRDLRFQVAKALVNQGIAQGQLGDPAAEIETYGSMVERFGDSEDREMQDSVAKALQYQGITQGQLGESAAAIETFASVIERFGESEDRELQVQVAQALVSQGVTQGQLGDPAAAIETFASVIEHFGESEDRELQVQVARALFNQGIAQGKLGDPAAAIEAYDSVVERFGEREDRELQVQVARALFNQGIAQGQLGDPAAEIETYGSMVERFGDSEDREMQDSVAKALQYQGITQGQLGESAAAIETFASVIERFGESEDRELQVQVAQALVNQGVTQGELGDPTAAIETFASVIERFGQNEDRELQVQVAKALFNQGIAQGKLGDPTAEIETYGSVVERFGDSKDRGLQAQVAKALLCQGITQGELGESAAAIETCGSVVERFGESEDRELQVQVARALFTQGIAQGQLGDPAAAIETFASVIERFGASEDRELQVHVAMALVNQGVAQYEFGDSATAIETFALVVDRFESNEDRKVQVQVAMASSNAGEYLSLMGATDEALQKVDQLRAVAERHGLESFLIRADWVDAMARASRGEMGAVEELFRAICSRFDPNDDAALRTFQEDVPTLVALGAAPAALARVLEEHEAAHAALRPLAVALRREAGEPVRAPAEVLEVADDIQSQIESTRKKIKR